jgi:AcrR family transcriptional regulator
MAIQKADADAPKPDGRSARAERMRAETQARILRAACAGFAEQGYHRTSVEDIINQAGIARGTFYLYFEAKRAVLEALLQETLKGIAGSVTRIELDHPDPPRVQLLANLERVWAVFASNPQTTRIVLGGLHGVDPEFDAQVGALEATVKGMIVRSIKRGQEMGLLHEFDPNMGACSLIGAFKENLADELLRSGTPPHGSQRVEEMLDVLMLGAGTDLLRALVEE